MGINGQKIWSWVASALFWRNYSTPECQCVCYIQLNRETRFLHPAEQGGGAITNSEQEGSIIMYSCTGLGHLGKEQSLWRAVFSSKYLRGKVYGRCSFRHIHRSHSDPHGRLCPPSEPPPQKSLWLSWGWGTGGLGMAVSMSHNTYVLSAFSAPHYWQAQSCERALAMISCFSRDE